MVTDTYTLLSHLALAVTLMLTLMCLCSATRTHSCPHFLVISYQFAYFTYLQGVLGSQSSYFVKSYCFLPILNTPIILRSLCAPLHMEATVKLYESILPETNLTFPEVEIKCFFCYFYVYQHVMVYSLICTFQKVILCFLSH